MRFFGAVFWGFLSLCFVVCTAPFLFWLRSSPRAEPLDPDIDSNDPGQDVDVRR